MLPTAATAASRSSIRTENSSASSLSTSPLQLTLAPQLAINPSQQPAPCPLARLGPFASRPDLTPCSSAPMLFPAASTNSLSTEKSSASSANPASNLANSAGFTKSLALPPTNSTSRNF